jgi:hypothetical protein
MTRGHRSAHLWIWLLVAGALGAIVALSLLERNHVEAASKTAETR